MTRPIEVLGRSATAFVIVALAAGRPGSGHEPERTTPRRSAAVVFAGRPAVPGTAGEELRQRFADALVPGRRSLTALPVRQQPDSLLVGLHREIGGEELAYAEYELFGDRVVRLRWCLAERFELPIFPALVHQVVHYLGKPEVEELLQAGHRPGAATLRRARWTRGGHSLELRQLIPLTGGPVFLTLTDERAVKDVIAAGEVPPPQPAAVRTWWQRRRPAPRIPSEEERRQLVWAFDDVLSVIVRALR